MANYGITGSNLPGTPANLSADVNQRQPSNTSYLSPTSFRFYIGRVPAVTYFCQAANIPSIDLPELVHSNPFTDTPIGPIIFELSSDTVGVFNIRLKFF